MWWKNLPWKTIAKAAGVLVPLVVVFSFGCRQGKAIQAKADAKAIDQLVAEKVELKTEIATVRARLETRDQVLETVRSSILEAGENRQAFLDALEQWRSQPSRIVERIERVPVEITSEICEDQVGESLAIVRHIAEAELEREGPP